MARTAGFDKEDVLEKAMRLFWKRGFNGTSLKDLELALDMRPGSIYAAFGSKDALFCQTLERYAEKSVQQLSKTLENAETPIAGLAAHVRNLGSGISGEKASNACMLVKTMLETTHTNPELKDHTETLIQKVESGFADAFRQAQSMGLIDQGLDTVLLASRLQSDIFGLRAYAERSVNPERVAQIAEEIAVSQIAEEILLVPNGTLNA